MLRKLITFLLPWPLRRRALQSWFGFSIHPSARIGLAWVFPQKLIMAQNARIDHLTVAVNLDYISMGVSSSIGRGNWITGFSTRTTSRHFSHQPGRSASLIIGDCAAITKRHHIDCTNTITIGKFTTLAGYRSQLITHGINVLENRQDSAPITIGDYNFIGTNVVILGGAVLPSYSVLGAKSLLNKAYTNEYMLYGGVPAKPIKPMPANAKYFTRHEGFVY